MKIAFTLSSLCLVVVVNAQVGIGTTTPLARLHVVDSSVLFSAPGDVPASPTVTPVSGDGRRMMWYADKAAFRAGYLTTFAGTYWDMNNIGKYSFATGRNTLASGDNAFAAVSGQATASDAIAIGNGAQASASNAVAIGTSCFTNGTYSTTMGFGSLTSGDYAVAIGTSSRAAGMYSMAFGRFARVSHIGSCAISDASGSFTSDSVYSTGNNQMSMRFVGGYRLYTSMNLSFGVQVSAGGGSWSTISDKRKKENFKELNKEEVLAKLAALPVTRWNYKSQPANQQHIGPMAQDFYAAFHLDGVGNDTTINTVDIDGVNMVAIQVLEKRTSQLQQENEQLKKQLEAVNQRMEALEKILNKQENGKKHLLQNS